MTVLSHEGGCIACGALLTKPCARCSREICFDCTRLHPATGEPVCVSCRLDVLASSIVHYQAHELVSAKRTACDMAVEPSDLTVTSIWRHYVTCEACTESVYFQQPHFRWPELAVAQA